MFLEENLIRIILIFFFIKIFSSYSCDSPDKNDYIKHDVIDLIFLHTFSIGGKKKSESLELPYFFHNWDKSGTQYHHP